MAEEFAPETTKVNINTGNLKKRIPNDKNSSRINEDK